MMCRRACALLAMVWLAACNVVYCEDYYSPIAPECAPVGTLWGGPIVIPSAAAAPSGDSAVTIAQVQKTLDQYRTIQVVVRQGSMLRAVDGKAQLPDQVTFNAGPNLVKGPVQIKILLDGVGTAALATEVQIIRTVAGALPADVTKFDSLQIADQKLISLVKKKDGSTWVLVETYSAANGGTLSATSQWSLDKPGYYTDRIAALAGGSIYAFGRHILPKIAFFGRICSAGTCQDPQDLTTPAYNNDKGVPLVASSPADGDQVVLAYDKDLFSVMGSKPASATKLAELSPAINMMAIWPKDKKVNELFVLARTMDNSYHGIDAMGGNNPYSLAVPDDASALAFGDVNSDGFNDAAYAVGSKVHILINDGMGSLKADTSHWPDLSVGGVISALAVGDVNNDGRADIAVLHGVAVSPVADHIALFLTPQGP